MAGIPREGGQQGSTQNRERASTRWVRFGLLPALYARSPALRSVFFPKPGDGGKAGGLPEGHQVQGKLGRGPSMHRMGGDVPNLPLLALMEGEHPLWRAVRGARRPPLQQHRGCFSHVSPNPGGSAAPEEPPPLT